MDVALTPAQSRREPIVFGDWLFASALVAAGGFGLARFGGYMDSYEKAILVGAVITLSALGWAWKPFRLFFAASAAIALGGISLYGNDLDLADKRFLLKYFLSSQSALMWMSALYFMSAGAYWIGLLRRSQFALATGARLCWIATAAGLGGMLIRWYESYLIGPDVGRIPISNLYEVFVLFCLITALLYLFYERRYGRREVGAFVMLVICAAVGFLLWYAFSRGAHEIQPLVPALQSYWMKLHVPANFIGYGAFALAAMVAVPSLLVHKGILTSRLPDADLLDDLMYKSIAIGFAFFTIATILGAVWAAEAWGGYWSWDPKETWALIVWLNYAAWLHLRLSKGVRGPALAWWALIGLAVTLFAFIGVNMFLSGLHSYGRL